MGPVPPPFYEGWVILAALVSYVTRRDVHARRSQPKLSLATEELARVFAGNPRPNRPDWPSAAAADTQNRPERNMRSGAPDITLSDMPSGGRNVALVGTARR